jgi:hypothetical protein
VALLSTKEEVNNAMKMNNHKERRQQKDEKNQTEKDIPTTESNSLTFNGNPPRPTTVTSDQNVQKFGNEAIGVIGKREEWIQP